MERFGLWLGLIVPLALVACAPSPEVVDVRFDVSRCIDGFGDRGACRARLLAAAGAGLNACVIITAEDGRVIERHPITWDGQPDGLSGSDLPFDQAVTVGFWLFEHIVEDGCAGLDPDAVCETLPGCLLRLRHPGVRLGETARVDFVVDGQCRVQNGEALTEGVGCDGVDDDCDGQVDEGVECEPECTSIGEVCNAVDDDCDGRVDEGAECEPDCTPIDEVCNRLDDDCDGVIDEFPEPCTIGDAPGCEEAGVYICGPDEQPRCEPRPETGTPEAPEGCEPDAVEDCNCNGLDDDCDGQTDEGVGAPPAAEQRGVCAGSTQVCQPNADGTREWVEPGPGDILHYESPERSCDGQDNDCDGRTDEDRGDPGSNADAELNLAASVRATQGGPESVCAGLTLVCDQGAPREPTPDEIRAGGRAFEEVERTCDGADNDCDGEADETDDLADIGEGCQTGEAGVCGPGTRVCREGALACDRNTEPSEEVCNGEDDDCDTSVDEGVFADSPDCETGLSGECAAGTSACVGGMETCRQSVARADETCDGRDNDCDGVVDDPPFDEDIPRHSLGRGICMDVAQVCQGGLFVDPDVLSFDGTDGADGTCNGDDNDCDGIYDEGAPGLACGAGEVSSDAGPLGEANRAICVRGTRTCPRSPGEGYLPCDGETDAAEREVCDNGFDDDCDGWADEGCLGGPCRLDECLAGEGCRAPADCPAPPEGTTRGCFDDGPNGRCGFGPEGEGDVAGCSCRPCALDLINGEGSFEELATCARCAARLTACSGEASPDGYCAAMARGQADRCYRVCEADADCRPGWRCAEVMGWSYYEVSAMGDDVTRANFGDPGEPNPRLCLPR